MIRISACIALLSALLTLFIMAELACDDEDLGEGATFTIVDRTCNLDLPQGDKVQLRVSIDGKYWKSTFPNDCEINKSEGYVSKDKEDIDPGGYTISIQYGNGGAEAETEICLEKDDNAELNVYGCDGNLTIQCKGACGGC